MEEDVCDENEPTMSSTLSKHERDAINKLLIGMALLYYTCDVDFRNLVVVHELAIGKTLTGILDFVMANSLNNV